MAVNDQATQRNAIPELWDSRSTAKRLGIAYQTLRHYVSQGRIPYVKIGGRCMFDPAEIARWIDEHRRPARARSD